MALIFGILAFVVFYTAHAEPLKPFKIVLWDENTLPFASIQGPQTNWSGFEIDIAAALCKRFTNGCEYVLVSNLDDRFQTLIDGTADISIGSNIVTPERKERVNFVRPYYYATGYTLYSNSNKTITWTSIAGQPICAIDGSSYVKDLKEKWNAKVVLVNDGATATSKVQSGECLAYAYDVGADMELPPVPDLETQGESPYGIALNKTAPPYLYDSLAAGMIQLMSAGNNSEMISFAKKWLNQAGYSEETKKLVQVVTGVTDFYDLGVDLGAATNTTPTNASVPVSRLKTVVAVYTPPTNYSNFEAGIVKYLCNTTVECTSTVPVASADGRLEVVNNKTADWVIGTLTVTAERANSVTFIHPFYYSAGAVLYATPQKAKSLSGWNAIENQQVCTLSGYWYNSELTDKWGANLVLVSTTDEGVSNAKSGKCVVWVYDSGFSFDGLENVKGADVQDPSPYSIAIAKDANPLLYSSLSAGLVRIMQDDYILGLEKEYIVDKGGMSNPNLAKTVNAIRDFAIKNKTTNGAAGISASTSMFLTVVLMMFYVV